MDDFSAFTDAERALLGALDRRGVRFMVVGLSAAVLQGANTGTRDIDLWFERFGDPRIGEAASKRSTGRAKDLAALPALEEALVAASEPPERT